MKSEAALILSPELYMPSHGTSVTHISGTPP